MLLRRKAGREQGTWSPPGGHLEKGETPLQGALREFGEETAYHGPFQVGRSWENKSRSRTYPMRVRSFKPTLSSEHDQWMWASPKAAARLPLYSTFRHGLKNVDSASDLGAYMEEFMGQVELEEFYPQTARGETPVYAGEKVHRGQRVGWAGTPGELFEVDSDYAYPIEGNIFDYRKLAAVAGSGSQRPVFRPGYGIFSVVDADDIRESLEYGVTGYGRPYTTGDEELDYFLTFPDYAIEERDGVSPGERGYKAAKTRFERELRAAERRGDGDFGALTVQVRDGNHRTFGAIIGGESTVWVQIYGNQLQDLQNPELQYPRIRRLRKELGIRPRRRRR